MREIDLDLRIRAERLEDDVAALALRGFLFRQLTRFDQALHERLIFGDLMRCAAADQIGATVADLGEIEVIVEHPGGRRRRAHAAHLGVRLCMRVNARVGDLDRLLEPVGKALRRCLVFGIPRLHEVRVDRIGCHLAR